MKHFAVFLMLSACSPLTATWEGDCDYGVEEIQIELELVQDGEDISGDGTISYLFANTLFTVDVEVDGEKDAEDIELDLETETLDTMIIDAILMDRQTITGECDWGAEGVLSLDRVD